MVRSLPDHHPNSDETRIAAILLAAGRSARMPAPKLLLPLGDRPVIAHVVAAILASRLRPIIVILGRDAAALRSVLPSPRASQLVYVENRDFADGLSTSLKSGIRALPADVTGAAIILGDQPFLMSADLDRLTEAATRTHGHIVTATYSGRRGSPTYFPSAYFSELLQVSGDTGGREVIARHPDATVACELSSDAALDIDTPADYARAREVWERRQA